MQSVEIPLNSVVVGDDAPSLLEAVYRIRGGGDHGGEAVKVRKPDARCRLVQTGNKWSVDINTLGTKKRSDPSIGSERTDIRVEVLGSLLLMALQLTGANPLMASHIDLQH